MGNKELQEELKKHDIFVDFGEGDKFYIGPDNIEIDEMSGKIILHGSQGQVRWIRIDENFKRNNKIPSADKRVDYEEELSRREVVLSYENVKDLSGKCYFDIDMFPERMEIFRLEVTESEIIQHCAWCTSMNGDILEFSDKLSETPVKAKDTYFGSELLMIQDPDDVFLKEITPEFYEEILGKIKTFLGFFDDTDKRFDTEFEPIIQKINSL